jgi:hypothetical protein
VWQQFAGDEQIRAGTPAHCMRGGTVARVNGFFNKDDQLFRIGGAKYALSNQWGSQARDAAELIAKAFPEMSISINVD